MIPRPHRLQSPSRDLPRLEALRTIVVLIMAVGYASTMPLGPDARELGELFGYQPSWIAVQVLFGLSGYLCLRSLRRHGSGFRMVVSRARRNLPLLALVTALVVGVIYPALRDPASPHGAMSVAELASYFAMTVSCADPSRVMPGAMDEAHYACLLQGAVWTFRWGAVAYLGAALAWHMRLLSRDRFVFAWAGLAAIAYFAVHLAVVRFGVSGIDPVETGLRLFYPFAAGMAVFAVHDSASKSDDSRDVSALPALSATALAAFAGVNFHMLTWTPLIEMSLVAAALILSFSVLHSRGAVFAWMENWSPLALPLFLLNWPVAQIWLYAVPSITPVELVSVTLATIVATALALRANARTTLPEFNGRTA